MVELFTTETCPKCKILKKKLDDKGVKYKIGDNQVIVDAGYRVVPMLRVDGELLDFLGS